MFKYHPHQAIVDDNYLDGCDHYGLEYDVAVKYAKFLSTHISAVISAGIALGLKKEQLVAHDSSKFYPVEFRGFALMNFADDLSELDAAFHHHLWNKKLPNLHHWNCWVIPPDNTPVVMPEKFVVEMVADWHGVSYAKTGIWDISNWFSQYGIHSTILHDDSWKVLWRVMESIGYSKDDILMKAVVSEVINHRD